MLSLIALVGTGSATLLSSSLEPQYVYYEESHYSQIVIIRDTNGNLSTSFHHNLYNMGEGIFNLTLPIWRSSGIIELNESVHEVHVKPKVHFEIPSEQEEILHLKWGVSSEIAYECGNIIQKTPRRNYLISSGYTTESTWSTDIILNQTTIDEYNITMITVASETMYIAECNASYGVNYAFSLDISLIYEHPSEGRISPYAIAFMALGILSIVMLLFEIRNLEESKFINSESNN